MTSSTITVDAAAQASIGAAAKELHLPTVRAEALRLAEIAVRERQTHLGYLAEVLAAEVDDRSDRRRTRRINEAHFPRVKRLADFNVDAVPGIQPAQLAALAKGGYMDAPTPSKPSPNTDRYRVPGGPGAQRTPITANTEL